MSKTVALALTVLLTALAPNPLGAQTMYEQYELDPGTLAAYDYYGTSADVHNGVAIIGAERLRINGITTGAAYLHDTSTGQFKFRLLAADAAAQDDFGRDVGIYNDIAIVGAPWNSDQGEASGSAYLFDATSGVQLMKLRPSDGSAYGFFGASVAIQGNRALIGSPAGSGGAVYAFDVSTGQEIYKLVPTDNQPGDVFGADISISGDLVLIGAWGSDQILTNGGAVYVYNLNTGQLLVKLQANDPIADARFGSRVALDGTLALVSSRDHMGRGAVHVFDVTTGQELNKIMRVDWTLNDYFGSSLDLNGNLAIIGEINQDLGGPNTGAVYLYDALSGNLLSQLVHSAGSSFDLLGSAVAIDGQTAVVTAPEHEGATIYEGGAWSFDLSSLFEPGDAFCLGDGSGTACPCNASGATGEGCANSSGQGGATLTASGVPSIANGGFELSITGVPGSKPGLILRGVATVNGGLGTPAGDGLLCVAGQSARSHIQVTSSGNTVFTNFAGQSLGAASYGPGNTTNYQFWYRDAQNPCSGTGFNFTNAWTVNWMP